MADPNVSLSWEWHKPLSLNWQWDLIVSAFYAHRNWETKYEYLDNPTAAPYVEKTKGRTFDTIVRTDVRYFLSDRRWWLGRGVIRYTPNWDANLEEWRYHAITGETTIGYRHLMTNRMFIRLGVKATTRLSQVLFPEGDHPWRAKTTLRFDGGLVYYL